jgi:hypothetical protein
MSEQESNSTDKPLDLHVPSSNDERVKAIRASSVSMLNQSDLIVIDSNDMYEIANSMLSEVHAKSKELEARKSAIIDPLNSALKAVRALFKPAEEQLDVAKSTLKRKMIAYQDELERKRLEAAAEAEKQRQAELAQAQADAAAAEAAVEEALASGNTEAFVAAADRVADVDNRMFEIEVGTAHTPVATKPSGGGHALGKTYKAEIINMPAFLRFMAEQLEKGDTRFDKTVDIKLGQLNKFGSATKNTVQVPGVLFKEERTLAAR